MSKPIIRIHNLETDQIIDREMNDSEYKLYEMEQATELKIQAEVKATATAKAALLDRLGITAEEAALLLL